ncbi:MAG TPA: DUF3365 domain-containing protein [Chitinophagaceae bacterium]|jgi:Protein of unknown function (DUF3365)|nr:DUF3365 domain-containing protein [Chitinophagaceae bacterium]
MIIHNCFHHYITQQGRAMKTTALFIFTIALSATAYADDTQQRMDQSKEVTKAFMTELKGELETAIKAGGPVNAISVCNLKAQKIAQHHSQAHNWEVRRTSMKPRNAINAPDKWELNVLSTFEARKAKGESLDNMVFSETVNENGKKYFRFMKAIPTGEVCLKCHGTDIEQPVVSKLDELYPADQARGYKAGDIRGAFSIKQPM